MSEFNCEFQLIHFVLPSTHQFTQSMIQNSHCAVPIFQDALQKKSHVNGGQG